jgi:hypothetical protein
MEMRIGTSFRYTLTDDPFNGGRVYMDPQKIGIDDTDAMVSQLCQSIEPFIVHHVDVYE